MADPAANSGPCELTTSDGLRLQAEQFVAPDARANVVILHPHPTMGGDMFTPVPAALFSALGEASANGVRFNFRGVGRSEGNHDHGQAEQLDVQAAVDAAAALDPDLPVIMAGWSWGADLSLMSDDPRLAAWLLCAAPLKVHPPETMPARLADAPKLFAVPENDHISPPAATTATTQQWVNTRVDAVAETDHFFGGALPRVVALLSEVIEMVQNG